MNEHFEFDVRIPQFLIDQLKRGEITPSMLTTMTLLYSWANWKTGRVRNASAGGLRTASQKAYSERTFSDSLKRLEEMGWITRHMILGSHKDYPITLHNYKWVCDDTCEEHKEEGAGKVHILNPKELADYVETQIARCHEASNETSDEECEEGSDETSDKVLSKHLSSNQPEDLSHNLPKSPKKESKEESKKAVADAPAHSSMSSEIQGSSELVVPGLDSEDVDKRKLEFVKKTLSDQAWSFVYDVAVLPDLAEKLYPVALEIMYFLFQNVCHYWVCLDWALDLHRWNAAHKSGKMVFGANLSQMLTALRSPSAQGLLQQYKTCTTLAGRRGCSSCKRSQEPFYVIETPPAPAIPPTREEVADRLEKAVATGKAGISKKNNADLVVLTKDGSAISLTISNVNVDKVVDGKKVWDKDHTIDQLVKDPEVWQQFKEYTEWMMPAFGEAASA